MELYSNSNTSASRNLPCIPPAGYRVVALHRDRSQSLVTLAQNLRAARIFAKAFRDAVERSGYCDGILTVRVEEWLGTLTEGKWVNVSPRRGRFSHKFVTCCCANRDQHNASLPKTGDKVQCILLGEKTRKGGWRAKFVAFGADGPITNTADVPKSAKPGQVVTLRVGVISHKSKRVQFHWHPDDNPSEQ